MAISSDQVKVTQFESPDCSSLEKIRWSIQQSLRKQLSQLSSDFFDVVDDFLFLNGQQGQSADNWIYLRSMRELCAKQVLFEETFLDQLIQTTETSHRNCALKAGEVEPSSIQKQPEVHEGIEIDRAIQAMSRRAMKSHRLFIQQIKLLNTKLGDSLGQEVILGDALINATTDSFSEAQNVFALPLDIRLIFSKLFEQHFLLKMEKSFLAIIKLLKKANDFESVDKTYTSASENWTQIQSVERVQNGLQCQTKEASSNNSLPAKLIEAAVSELISTHCDEKDLPGFVEKMIRTEWRTVMLSVGLSHGNSSIEWSEAKHSLSLLVTAASNRLTAEPSDHMMIKERLRRGFELIRMPESEQQHFFTELDSKYMPQTVFVSTNGEAEDAEKTLLISTRTESSISPAGEQILDREDMNEITKLLADE